MSFLRGMRGWLVLVIVFTATPALGNGVMEVEYLQAYGTDTGQWRKSLIDGQFLELTGSFISGYMPLRQDVLSLRLLAGECNQPNAFYVPAQVPPEKVGVRDFEQGESAILFCYELFGDIVQKFHSSGVTGNDQLRRMVKDTTVFIFFHELGHALISLFNIPAVGQEEDAVDQFATFLMTNDRIPELEAAAMNAARFWWLSSKSSKGGIVRILPFETIEEQMENQRSFADSHDLTEQRFYNVICWVYGNNPSRWQEYVDKLPAMKDRAKKSCKSETIKMRKAWGTLLRQYALSPRKD